MPRGPEQPLDPTADAYWKVPAIDYVPRGEAPRRGLLDSPAHVDSAWEATVASLQRDAHATEEQREKIIRKADKFNARVRECAKKRKKDKERQDATPAAA